MPTPKWKLVVDIAAPSKQETHSSSLSQIDSRANELLQIIRSYTPLDKTSPLAMYLPGFTSLRLLLEKPERTPREDELGQTLVESFSSYGRSGKDPSEIAWMVARDYMVLSQHAHAQPNQIPQQQQIQHQHQQMGVQQFSQSSNAGLSSFQLGMGTGNNDVSAGFSLSGAQNGTNNQVQTNQQFFPSGPSVQNTLPLAFSQIGQAFDF
jgi:hypothetical protein